MDPHCAKATAGKQDKGRKCWLDFAARKLTLNEKGSCQLPLQKNEF
jgi:hypothetical protein